MERCVATLLLSPSDSLMETVWDCLTTGQLYHISQTMSICLAFIPFLLIMYIFSLRIDTLLFIVNKHKKVNVTLTPIFFSVNVCQCVCVFVNMCACVYDLTASQLDLSLFTVVTCTIVYLTGVNNSDFLVSHI